jgi:hypothetical protein
MKQQNRKEIIRAYKGIKQVGGVYIIRNTVTGKEYLDSAVNIESSRNRFEFSKSTNSCVYKWLERDWAEYGKDAFVFEVLETLERGDDQAAAQFKEDIQTLQEIWEEKRNTTGQNEQK